MFVLNLYSDSKSAGSLFEMSRPLFVHMIDVKSLYYITMVINGDRGYDKVMGPKTPSDLKIHCALL